MSISGLELTGWSFIEWQLDRGLHPTDADFAEAFGEGPPPAKACAYLQRLFGKEIDRRGRRPVIGGEAWRVAEANRRIERVARWRRVFAVRYHRTDPMTAAQEKVATEYDWKTAEVARKRLGEARKLAAPWLVALLDDEEFDRTRK
jgi:hypothetical protein